MNKVLALIDGEHYPPVVKDALDWIHSGLGKQVVAAVFLGGEEKIREGSDHTQLGVPVKVGTDPVAALSAAIDEYGPDEVIDLSDEPVVGYRERFQLASRTLLKGVSYVGADFRFDPPSFETELEKPTLAVAGLGKRVGKTSISAYLARLVKDRGHELVVVAMGRGGPGQPELLDGAAEDMDAEFLLAKSAEGKHAASDYFEDALVSGVKTVGCRRCGGGMAGQPFVSNVVEGAQIADATAAELVVFEGSGAALPPVKVDSWITVAGAGQPIEYFRDYFGPFRLLMSDLVVLTGCEAPLADRRAIERILAVIDKVKPGLPVVQTVFRPLPVGDIKGTRVFVATTAPPQLESLLKDYIENEYSCQVTAWSSNLSRAARLESDLNKAKGSFDTILTEVKAAGVDVATRAGEALGARVVYADNVPRTVNGAHLDELLYGRVEEVLAGVVGQAGRRGAGR